MFIDNNRVTRSDVNQKILAACAYHKQSADDDDWITDLKKNCLAQKQQQTTALLNSDAHRLQQSIESTIDTIMDALGSYTVLFNQDTDFELYLSVTAPSLISDGTDERGKTRVSYAGRISSRSWSIVVASKDDSIEFLLVPSAQLLNLSRMESVGEPICVLKAVMKERSVYWRFRDEVLHSAELGKIYQEAFKILIETIYRDMDDIIEKRKLERRQSTERRQGDRRQNPQLWQGLTSPVIDRRKNNRRSESNDRRNRVEKSNRADAEAHRIIPPDVNQIIIQAEQNNAHEIALEERSADLREWITNELRETQSLPSDPGLSESESLLPHGDAPAETLTLSESEEDGWVSYQSEIESTTFTEQWQEYSGNGWTTSTEDDDHEQMELTAFDKALLKLLQENSSEFSSDEKTSTLDQMPALEIDSPKPVDMVFESLLAEQDRSESNAEYEAFLEQDLDKWVREILAIDQEPETTSITVPTAANADEEEEAAKEIDEDEDTEDLEKNEDEEEDEFEFNEDEEGEEEEEETFAKIDDELEATATRVMHELRQASASAESDSKVFIINEDEQLAPGSAEHDILQFLSRLAFTFDSPADVSLKHLHSVSGGKPMGRELTSLISQSLRDLIEEEETALGIVIRNGSEAFTQKSFEQVEICLKEAILRRRAVDMITGLKTQWAEFVELENFVSECQTIVSQSDIDTAISYCTPERRLRLAIEMLMKFMMQLGAQSFQQMNFEQVHKICKHSANLQRFQKRVEEIYGDGQGIRQSTRIKETDLVAA